jgi:nicotinamide-nucleotide amidase
MHRRPTMGTPSHELSALVAETAHELIARRDTLATAESCTGGWIAKALTDPPGSSAWYRGGVIAYADAVKVELLEVRPELLAEYGAVSEEVVRTMAESSRRRFGADWAIATSGIAGPDGGTPDKPVGTVWVAWASQTGVDAECLCLDGDREGIRLETVRRALLGLLKRVEVTKTAT